jgi:hypothetical protein
LPRQARDKHRKRAFVDGKDVSLQVLHGNIARGAVLAHPVKKVASFARFLINNGHFTKTGSGQT